jgi:hypothetical protein
VSGEAYLRIRRVRRPEAGVFSNRMQFHGGMHGIPVGWTIKTKREPFLNVKLDGRIIGANRWESSDHYPDTWPQPAEAWTDYVIQSGEHLLGLAVRLAFGREGAHCGIRFSVEPGAMHTVVCQYNKYDSGWSFLHVIPEELCEIKFGWIGGNG